MSGREEIREFLTSRRARIRPETAGIPGHDPRRRVAGLRREEVATLAGVSVDYYVRMERGRLQGVSESALEGVARALQMTQAEREHLFNLARLANGAGPSRWASPSKLVRPNVQGLIDSMSAPAWVRNGRLDLLAANHLGAALYAPLFDQPTSPPNKARFLFFDPRARDLYPQWTETAASSVAVLRAAAGANPFDRALSDLIGELSTRSLEFRSMWAEHDVVEHGTGIASINHPVAGPMELSYEAMALNADLGLTLVAYAAAPGSESAERLALLASWAESERQETVTDGQTTKPTPNPQHQQHT